MKKKIYREMVAAVARRAHNPKVVSSILTLATKKKLHKKFDKLKSLSYLCETIGNNPRTMKEGVLLI